MKKVMVSRKKTMAVPAKQDGNEYFANLFLLFFGSGTFALPWGFARAGLIGGTAGVVVVGFMTWLTISMLVRSKRMQQRRLLFLSRMRRDSFRSLSSGPVVGGAADDEADDEARSEALQQSLTYAAIASHAFGTPNAGRVVKAATTFSCLGACGGFLTFVSGLLLPLVRQAAEAYLHSSSAATTASSAPPSPSDGLAAFFSVSLGSLAVQARELEQASLVWLLLPLLVPLTWVRSFKGLVRATVVGNAVFLASVVLVLLDGWERFGWPSWPSDFNASQGGDLRLFPESVAAYSLFINPCIYLFTVHYCALPIEAEGSSLIGTAAADAASDPTTAPTTTAPTTAPTAANANQSAAAAAAAAAANSNSTIAPTSSSRLLRARFEIENLGDHGSGGSPGASAALLQTNARGSGSHLQRLLTWGETFDGALVLSIVASVLLNALFGAFAYATFGTAPRPPLLGGGGGGGVNDDGGGGGSSGGGGGFGWRGSDEVEGCDSTPPYMCDDVVKNVNAGALKVVTSVALALNLALTYVLMLAPSRQYIEAAALHLCTAACPHTFKPKQTADNHRSSRRHQQSAAVVDGSDEKDGAADAQEERIEGGDGVSGTGGAGGEGGGEEVEEEEEEVGQWSPGEDGWARCGLRNTVRTALVLLTAVMSLAIPHFALLTGLIGGMTDALQSFVLPPLIYFLESSRSAATAASTATPPPKPPKSPQYSAINTHEQTLEGRGGGGGHFNRQSFCSLLALHTCRGSGVSWRQRLELWGCLFLSLFGAVYIVLTTTNNVKTIIEFVHSK